MQMFTLRRNARINRRSGISYDKSGRYSKCTTRSSLILLSSRLSAENKVNDLEFYKGISWFMQNKVIHDIQME